MATPVIFKNQSTITYSDQFSSTTSKDDIQTLYASICGDISLAKSLQQHSMTPSEQSRKNIEALQEVKQRHDQECGFSSVLSEGNRLVKELKSKIVHDSAEDVDVDVAYNIRKNKSDVDELANKLKGLMRKLGIAQERYTDSVSQDLQYLHLKSKIPFTEEDPARIALDTLTTEARLLYLDILLLTPRLRQKGWNKIAGKLTAISDGNALSNNEQARLTLASASVAKAKSLSLIESRIRYYYTLITGKKLTDTDFSDIAITYINGGDIDGVETWLKEDKNRAKLESYLYMYGELLQDHELTFSNAVTNPERALKNDTHEFFVVRLLRQWLPDWAIPTFMKPNADKQVFTALKQDLNSAFEPITTASGPSLK